MANYHPIAKFPPQFSIDGDELASGYWLKGYQDGTTTALSMATDDTGGTTLAKCKLNTAGYPLSNDADDTTVFIPHFNQDFKLALYTNDTDADNDTTANAVWVVDNIPSQPSELANADVVVAVATSDGLDVTAATPGGSTLIDIITTGTDSSLLGLRGSVNGGVRVWWNDATSTFRIDTTDIGGGTVIDQVLQSVLNGNTTIFGNGTGSLVISSTGIAYTLENESVTTTNVITAAESGTTFFLNAAGGFTSTLPAPAAGLHYRFVVATAPTTAYIITTNSGANVLQGAYLDIVGELTAITNQDTLNFVANTSLVGDRMECFSDGTNWYVWAFSLANGGITVSVT